MSAAAAAAKSGTRSILQQASKHWPHASPTLTVRVSLSLYIYIYRIELLSLWRTHTRCMFLTLIPSFPHGRHTPYVESRSQCIQIGHWSGT